MKEVGGKSLSVDQQTQQYTVIQFILRKLRTDKMISTNYSISIVIGLIVKCNNGHRQNSHAYNSIDES